MSDVKRVCDWPGCLEWSVAAVVVEFGRGHPSYPSKEGCACRLHLDMLTDEATAKSIPIHDGREQ